MRLYRDPVHGDILLSPLAADILDTPEMQRLGRIMQLGFAHLVFRGATHTRLAHSVGTYWMARRILELVPVNHARLALPIPPCVAPLPLDGLPRAMPRGGGWPKGPGEGAPSFDIPPARDAALSLSAVTEIVAAAALLHDVTHIPFGHTLEDELQDVYLKHDALENPRLYFLLFDPRSALARLFDQPTPYVAPLDNQTLRWLIYLILAYREAGETDQPRSFAASLETARQIVGGNPHYPPALSLAYSGFLADAATRFRDLSERGLFHPFMADVVSGTVSADLIDYTARDLFFTGIRGAFDLRILQYFFIARDAAGQCRLALDVLSPRGYPRIDITTEIMNLMRLRYSMAERVYYHKTKVAASAMLARGLLGHNMPADTNPYDDPQSILRPEMGDEEMVRRLAFAPDDAAPTRPGMLAAREARELGWAIYNRALHLPAIVLTADLAREIGGAQRFVDFFRGRPYGRRNIADTQAALSAIAGRGPHTVLLYVPPFKMQAKAINALVRLEADRLVPLADHPDFREEAELLNRKYQALWKTFAFIHPDVARQPRLVAALAEEFCRRLEIPPAFARRLTGPAAPAEDEG